MDPDVIVCPMSPVSGDEPIGHSFNVKSEPISNPRHHHYVTNNNVAAGVPQTNCAACQKPIVDKYYLQAVDRLWHEECLKCSVCSCQLSEKGSLYTRTDLILCKRDYLRMFGVAGTCAACERVIPASELVMKAKDHVYHLDCFACSECNTRFATGERFYHWNKRLMCEMDFEKLNANGFSTPPQLLQTPGGGGRGIPPSAYHLHQQQLQVNSSAVPSSSPAAPLTSLAKLDPLNFRQNLTGQPYQRATANLDYGRYGQTAENY